MQIEPIELFGRMGRDFVSYADDGSEQFSARLWDDDTTLQILWSNNVPRTLLRLRDAQTLAGGIGGFDTITGQASDEFREMILAGEFDPDAAARLLSRVLGGVWRVEVGPRFKSFPATFDITATRL